MPDEPDEWSEPVAPLPPEDRLWRHPSEVAQHPATSATPRPRRGRRGLVAVAVVSGITGAAATVVALAAMGTLSSRAAEPSARRSTSPTVAAVATTLGARSVAGSVAPAVVEVTATDGDDRRQGSGVVMRADGLILTSASLVAEATVVTVSWPDGRSAPATARGHDDVTGLAALMVEGVSDLATATADPSAAKPGEAAITVGAGTQDQGPTLTQGVVSSVGAHVDPDDGRLLGLIETDQPVPDRADGGALIDDEGHFRGVCLRVPDETATGFAVPATVAERVADDLDEHGRVDRGWLGVRGTSSDPTDDAPAGVTIDEVSDGSPAQAADLRPGDVLTEVDGDPVRSLADVQTALALSHPGDSITVQRVRGGATATVVVTLTDTPG